MWSRVVEESEGNRGWSRVVEGSWRWKVFGDRGEMPYEIRGWSSKSWHGIILPIPRVCRFPGLSKELFPIFLILRHLEFPLIPTLAHFSGPGGARNCHNSVSGISRCGTNSNCGFWLAGKGGTSGGGKFANSGGRKKPQG